MAKFNDEQLAAIHASSKRDILITAGAGSGKTNTLAERVFNLIEKKEIEPESLLVLTFTNNASYEMKTRILDRFGEGHPLYPRMQSCHVQSFDSFRAYLVRANSQALNVPKTFSVLPSSIEEEKRRLLIRSCRRLCHCLRVTGASGVLTSYSVYSLTCPPPFQGYPLRLRHLHLARF